MNGMEWKRKKNQPETRRIDSVMVVMVGVGRLETLKDQVVGGC